MITVLKAEKIDLALLEAKYGFVTPQKVLQALQRDAIQGKDDMFQEDIYERPMIEVTITLNHGWCSFTTLHTGSKIPLVTVPD